MSRRIPTIELTRPIERENNKRVRSNVRLPVQSLDSAPNCTGTRVATLQEGLGGEDKLGEGSGELARER